MGGRIRQHVPFYLEIRLRIDMRGLDGFMSKPQADACNIDARWRELHGRGVAQTLVRYFLALQPRTMLRGDPEMLRQQVLNSSAAHSLDRAVGGYDLSVATRRFLQPRRDDRVVCLVIGAQRCLRPLPLT